MAPIRNNELAAECRPVIRVQENGATIRTAYAASHVVLDEQEIENLIRRHDSRRADIDQPTLHPRELRMRAKLRRIEHDFVSAEPSREDGSQQPGGWLDGKRDRHGPATPWKEVSDESHENACVYRRAPSPGDSAATRRDEPRPGRAEKCAARCAKRLTAVRPSLV